MTSDRRHFDFMCPLGSKYFRILQTIIDLKLSKFRFNSGTGKYSSCCAPKNEGIVQMYGWRRGVGAG